MTGTLNPLCSGSQSYTTSGTYTLTVDSSNVNCPMTFVVAGGGGGGGNNGGSVGAPGGDGGLNSFTFTPTETGIFNIVVGGGELQVIVSAGNL